MYRGDTHGEAWHESAAGDTWRDQLISERNSPPSAMRAFWQTLDETDRPTESHWPAWNPLLSGDLRDRALETAAALTTSLRSAHETGKPRAASLASGAAGLAVCHAMTAKTCGDRRAADLACAAVNAAIDVAATAPLSTSLYSGFPGITWAADLVEALLADAPDGTRAADPGGRDDGDDDSDDDDSDLNRDIDAALASTLRRYPQWGPYDLVDGLAGLGGYALARWPRPAAIDCLASVIERLAGRARRDGDGVYWWTTPTQMTGQRARQYPGGGVDLGVAHGMAGVIPLLARASALGIDSGTVRPLLDGAVRWTLAHLIEASDGPTVPGFVPDDADPLPTRSAWCYGDPGVAMALLLAARDAGEPSWERAGTELALRAAARPPELTSVTQAGICHGAAGLAHLFNRMYQLTEEPELARAALSWTKRTITMCEGAGAMCAGVGGAATIAAGAATIAGADGPAGRPAVPEAGLLEGAAGVVLVLLACCFADEPGWDQMLLVSTAGVAALTAESRR